MTSWFFNVYMVAVMKKVKMRMGRREESGDNLASFYAVDLVLCGESEEDQRAMVGHFGEVCVEKKRGLKVNAAKNKVMVLGGEEGLECEVYIDGIRLQHVLKFKYLGCVRCDVFWTNQVLMRQNVVGRWRVGGG